ncbi:protein DETOXIFICATION 16-like [Mercurialis annua]|uniref:protein DETOXIFICATION 16-like n=1 Tax=Mercurialis annua TaxID=3986 RepID=UPI00215E31E5|nr:protein DETOXIFICATION 16-like [Mercurialis annua]
MESGDKSNLEFSLIQNQELVDDDEELSERGSYCWKGEFLEEATKQIWVAGPLIAVSMLQYCLQVISIMFVGHLGELPLSSASVASSFASVTGFSVLLGMGSALETLCGQAYGAKQYHMLGIHTQRAMQILFSLTIPLAIIWFYTSSILIFLGQDHDISIGAGTFNRSMIPALFAYSLLQCLNKFIQAQNDIVPMMVTSAITASLHILVCWVLVFKSAFGSIGAALAITVSYWINVVLLALYIQFSSACLKTWTGFSKEALHDIISFVKLAIPSAIMICLEYWSFEMVVLLSGLLPNPKLETSVLSISLNTCWMVYMISVGLGGAIKSVDQSILDNFLFSLI